MFVLVNEKCYSGSIATKLRSLLKMRSNPDLRLRPITSVYPVCGSVGKLIHCIGGRTIVAINVWHHVHKFLTGVDLIPDSGKVWRVMSVHFSAGADTRLSWIGFDDLGVAENEFALFNAAATTNEYAWLPVGSLFMCTPMIFQVSALDANPNMTIHLWVEEFEVYGGWGRIP